MIDEYAAEVLPELNELAEYRGIFYQYYIYDSFLFCSETMMLVVTYDEQMYEKEKESLNDNYSFLRKTVTMESDPEYYLIPEYEFSIKSYDIRVIGNESTFYPHFFGMTAVSDKYFKIVYLFFYDTELDFIDGPGNRHTMAQFVKRYFPYNWR